MLTSNLSRPIESREYTKAHDKLRICKRRDRYTQIIISSMIPERWPSHNPPMATSRRRSRSVPDWGLVELEIKRYGCAFNGHIAFELQIHETPPINQSDSCLRRSSRAVQIMTFLPISIPSPGRRKSHQSNHGACFTGVL